MITLDEDTLKVVEQALSCAVMFVKFYFVLQQIVIVIVS